MRYSLFSMGIRFIRASKLQTQYLSQKQIKSFYNISQSET
jgi:hypothetical protein